MRHALFLATFLTCAAAFGGANACDVDAIMVEDDSLASRNNLLACLSDMQEQLNATKAEIHTQDQNLRALRAEHATLYSLFLNYVNRSWINKSRDRSISISYRNNTQNPMEVSVTILGAGTGNDTNACDLQVIVNSNRILWNIDNGTERKHHCTANFTVPIGGVYQINSKAFGSNSGQVLYWYELS